MISPLGLGASPDMANSDYKSVKQSSDEEIVGRLLRLPAGNLERRVLALQGEIDERRHLANEILSTLGTRKLHLEDRLTREMYVSLISNGIKEQKTTLQQIMQLESSIASERISCFRDMSLLKEKMRQADEELQLAREKLRLFDTNDM